MSTPEAHERPPRNHLTIPRWAAVLLALFVCLIVIPLAHAWVPWILSKLTHRYGWEGRAPSIWNQLGLIPVVASAALLLWVLVSALAQTPDRVWLGLVPQSLIMKGPYGLTRNPMYLAELGLWMGWAAYFGSWPVLIGFAVLLSTVSLILVPLEERSLEAAFGQSYLDYKDKVPRWLGRTKK